jgi:hypothetical protein
MLSLKTIRSLVLDDIAARFNDENVCVAHIYFDYKDPEGQTMENIIRRLLKQLLLPLNLVPRQFRNLYDEQRRKARLPDLSVWIREWAHVSSKFSSVYLIFDALDECGPKVTREILQLTDKKLRNSNTKIMYTVRSHMMPIIREHFQVQSIIWQKIEAHDDDIKTYLTTRMEEEWRHAPDLIPDVVDVVSNGARGKYVSSFDCSN